MTLSAYSAAGVFLSALIVCLALSGASWAQPKRVPAMFIALIGTWYFTTTIWVAETKHIIQDLDKRELFPSTAFWVTFIPQVVSAVCIMCVALCRGSDLVSRTLKPSKDGSLSQFAWLTAGAAYFYGQLFTVLALSFSSPSITFVVKAVEPLSTALLAVPVLGQRLSMRVLIAVGISCVGIAITASGTHGGLPSALSRGSLLAMLFAVLANAGFSSRACIVKKAYSKKKEEPLDTFGRITIHGVFAGLLLFIVRPVDIGNSETRIMEEIWTHAVSWLAISLCYFLYQASSLLLLDCLEVESHALMVSMKHIFVVIFASLLLHSEITVVMIVGIVIACFGVCMYLMSPAPEAAEQRMLLPQAEGQKPGHLRELPLFLPLLVVVLVSAGIGLHRVH